MRTPIAFVVFNRPDLTERVFAEIAKARPPKLLVIADGPRPGVPGEAAKCAAVRDIVERVDWPCEVSRNYSDVNMGCARRPPSGLRWVFQQVEEAVILEDDCVPQPAFFRYCDELLERYRDDQRIMHISGNQFIPQPNVTPFSYSFSHYPLSWGWATWRRAFQHYDLGITLWPTLRETSWLLDILGDQRAVGHWQALFDSTFADIENVNTWDFQWVFACWVQSGLSVLPKVNLVSNIGFREDATHTKRATDGRAKLRSGELLFPLTHPERVTRDQEIDRRISTEMFSPRESRSFVGRLRDNCAAALPPSVRKSLLSLKLRFASSAEQP